MLYKQTPDLDIIYELPKITSRNLNGASGPNNQLERNNRRITDFPILPLEAHKVNFKLVHYTSRHFSITAE